MEYLELENYCKQQAAVAKGNRRRKFEELRYENLKKAKEAPDLPPMVKAKAKESFEELEERLGKKDFDNDDIASFDSKYPGVYQKNWSKVNWDEIALPNSTKNKLRSIALIALTYFKVQPKNCEKGPKRSLFLYGVPGEQMMKVLDHVYSFTSIPHPCLVQDFVRLCM